MKIDETMDLDIRIQKAPESEDYQVGMFTKDLNTCLHGLAQAIAEIGAETGLGAQKILCQLTLLLFRKK